jgi:hypothetical protein
MKKGMNRRNHFIEKLVFVFFLTLVWTNAVISQTVLAKKTISFHPAVGLSIDLSEKKELHIFTEYNDSIFDSAVLLVDSTSNYSILFTTITGYVFEKPIVSSEKKAIYDLIEKVKPASAVMDPPDYYTVNEEKEKALRKERRQADAYRFWSEVTYQSVILILDILSEVVLH